MSNLAFKTAITLLCVLLCFVCSSVGVDEQDFLSSVRDGKAQREHTINRSLTADDVRENDLCRNYNGVLVKCNPDRFPTCEAGIELCLERVPLNSVKYIDKWKFLEEEKYFKHKQYYDDGKEHIIFVVDYRKVTCAPQIGWNCKRCANSALFCRKEGYCMKKKEWKASCLDKSNTRASEIRREQAEVKKEKRKQERAKRKERRRKNRQIQRKQKREEEKAAALKEQIDESKAIKEAPLQPGGD